MNTTQKLRDGTEVQIRLFSMDDLNNLFVFFQGIPIEDRVYLRFDISKRPIMEARLRSMQSLNNRRVLALIDDEIVAHGLLEMEGHGWREHIAEIRIIVGRTHRHNGLGMLMGRQLFSLASREQVEEIVVQLMRPQVAAQGIFQKLGFCEKIMFPESVKDLRGKKQDLIIMRCNLESLWQEWEHNIAASDWSYAP